MVVFAFVALSFAHALRDRSCVNAILKIMTFFDLVKTGRVQDNVLRPDNFENFLSG